ncbi:MAG TPA: carboxypeptidase-like regulatory domain-containing protein [Longimicrobiales bacterium]
MRRCIGLWALLIVAAGATEASAQNTIRGRVVDENQNPVTNIVVLLHRVTRAGGSGVAADTSDAQGAFVLTAPPDTDSTALYFVAVREGGELFMGEMQRMPFPDTLEYIIEAGDNPVNLGAPTQPVQPLQPEERRAGLYVIYGGILLIAAVLFFVLRRRAPVHRRVLVQLAQLEDDDQSEAIARRRRQLYARLKRDS